MSEYRLVVTRFDANPNYQEQLAEWKSRTRYDNYGNVYGEPSPITEGRALEVTLTEAEFEAVKRGVLEQFK